MDCVAALLQAGASVDRREPLQTRTPLMVAAQRGTDYAWALCQICLTISSR
jgi:hypothetical protein